jgi:ArsR family transcriptional regulator
VRRVLAPGGRLVVCDLASHGEEWMREKYGDQWLGFSPEEIGRFFDQAGFEQVSMEQHTDTPRAGILVAVARAREEGGEP